MRSNGHIRKDQVPCNFANVGKKAILTYTSGTAARSVEGTLLSVPAERKPEENEISPPVVPPYGSYAPYPRMVPEPAKPEMVLLRTVDATGKSSTLAINTAAVQ